MPRDIREVKNITDLIGYFSTNLGWDIDIDDFEDIEDISYDFDASDIGLKEESFAKISSLRQLQPLVDGQQWGIFCVEFDSNRFEPSALKKILSGLIPRKRNSADHAVWCQQDLLFICNWGKDNNSTIGLAHFEDREGGLPQIKMFSCAPALEDFTQIKVFEERLLQLSWPKNTSNIEEWRQVWSGAFTIAYKQTIQDSSTLTVQLAAEAQNIRNRILDILEVETKNGYVHLLFEKFKDSLIHDMTEQEFADMYAQTVVYGLFSARCLDTTQDDFSAAEAIDLLPNTNPFLKSLLRECFGAESKSRLSFDELEVGNVVDLLRNTKTDAIIQDFNRQTGGGREDPVIHFYEEFLTAYDKAQKIQRGVFYTPQPVVNFIVRAVDSIIKQEFGYQDGLASEDTQTIKIQRESQRRVNGLYKMIDDIEIVPAVQILDPATGTGTFLRQVILQIYENFCSKHKGEPKEAISKAWSEYVDRSLLPRVNGFELMMAPYAVAHMKLAMVLKDTGYDFHGENRLNVFLTNSLEEAGKSDMQMTLWDDPLATESIEANVVKKNKGISVILGNPPYSGISSNAGKWITSMIEDYKYINGVHFGERKHWLQDDYVKFIRFCENYLEQCDEGVLAFINNHAFIDNPTFRCMRYHLLESFDKIYILDLHGNVMKKEIGANGEKDENVFDIQQGVSINIFIRKKGSHKGLAEIYHADLFGKRSEKYDLLSRASFGEISWEKLSPNEPFYFFMKRDENYRDEYEQGFSIESLMPEHTTGVVTARDGLVIDSDRNRLLERIRLFADASKTDDETREYFFGGKKEGKYLPGDSRGWSLAKARQVIRNNNHEDLIQKIAYRPFDVQYIYYTPDMVDWGRDKLMANFLNDENIGLVIPRQAATDNWSHVQLTKYMADNRIHYSNKGIPIECPLYIYKNNMFGERVPNINKDIADDIGERIGVHYVYEEKDKKDNEYSPVDLIDYIYAILFSPKYRKKYLEFLKFDFPKVPYPKSADYFWRMVKYGKELRKLHLEESEEFDLHYEYCGEAVITIEKPYFENEKIFLNRVGAYISNVPESVWNMYFGGYQPLQKWLKDRKNTEIDEHGISHLRHMITVLSETEAIMQEIDNEIEA